MAQATRRLTAILSADVAGYSRLMGDDEPGTMAALAECHSVFRRLCDASNGRIVDTAGDSVLGVFDSVADAVLCAMAAQKTLAEWNDPRPRSSAACCFVSASTSVMFSCIPTVVSMATA